MARGGEYKLPLLLHEGGPMRDSFALIFCALLTLSTLDVSGASATPKTAPDPATQTESVKREMTTLKDSLEIVRRDQLNYKIEKDLLKDAFASNLQTINVVLTIVLGVFGVLSYVGFKGISALKDEYKKELESVKALKESLTQEIRKVESEQTSVKTELGKLSKENEEQDRRLKVLEIKEKVSQLIDSRKFALALEFCEEGLLLDPNNVSLLHHKATCQFKYAKFESAIECLEKVLSIQPGQPTAVENLCEAYLLTHQVAIFDAHYAKYKDAIDKARGGAMKIYIDVLRAAAMSNAAQIKDVMTPYVKTCSEGPEARLGASWSYDELWWYVNKMPDSELKKTLTNVTLFFMGKTPSKALLVFLQSPRQAPTPTV
jgi:tetratricopeptide (TPR) repeat protein